VRFSKENEIQRHYIPFFEFSLRREGSCKREGDLKVRSTMMDTVDLIQTPLPMAISGGFRNCLNSEVEMLHKYL